MNTKPYKKIMKNIANATILVLTIIALLILTSGCCDERLNVINKTQTVCVEDGVVYTLLDNGDASVSEIQPSTSRSSIIISSDVLIDGQLRPVRTINTRISTNADKLEAITIPETITRIEWGTFADCANLQVINLNGKRCPELVEGAFAENAYEETYLCYHDGMILRGNWTKFTNKRKYAW